jgi:F0F1-type ATP synthase membrane subunit b/b'
MIKFSTDYLALLIVILALLIFTQQYVAPKLAETLQERLIEAAKVERVKL